MKDFDKCTSWKNFSSIIEADAKLYGFRVDCVFNDTYKVLGVLNRGQKERERDSKFLFIM